MKSIITILAFIVAVQGSLDSGLRGSLDSGLRVRFDVGLVPGSTFFFDVPRVVSKAKAEGWIEKERYDGAPMESLVMYCYKDLVVCALYDDIEDVAGIQVSIPHEDFSGAIYSWTTLGFTNWTTAVNGTTKSFWSKNVYFASDETLAKSQEDRLAARAVSNVTLQEGFLLASGFNNELVSINRNASDVTSTSSIFKKQACFIWMGLHYYYNMSSTAVCSETTLFSWFPLVHSGETIGLGLIVPGQFATQSGERNWFENPDKTTIQTIVPDGPQCLYDMADSPGVVTMHIYFIDKPWLITCPSE